MTPIRVPAHVHEIPLAQFDALNARAAELRAAGRNVISLGQALPGFGPPASALIAAADALRQTDTHVYSADAGRPTLREALCRRLASTYGIQAATDDVIITAGGNQAFMLALMTLVKAGDEVLLPAPYFINHEMAVRAIGAMPKEVPLSETDGFALRREDLEPHVSSKTRAVVLCTPSNPTGAVIAGDEMRAIASKLAARGVVMIVDETYGRFVYDGAFESAASLPGWRENVVVVSTFSKSFGMTGWRVGYLLADAPVCEQAIKIQDAMIICAPVISQVAVEAAIRESWDYPSAFVIELVARRQTLAEGLARIPRLHWSPTGGGFFAFVKVERCTDSAALAADLLERAHVVTIPGATFGRSGEGFLRLSYGAATRDDLGEASGRLKAYFV